VDRAKAQEMVQKSKQMGRTSAFAVTAAGLSLKDARVSIENLDKDENNSRNI